MLTQEFLKQHLSYNKDTGLFTWLKINKYTKKIKIGDIAGSLDIDGYLRIGIFYKPYLAHRLAWLYVYGEWPKNQIDHINGIRNDNRIENLRDVSQRENCQNRLIHRNGKLVGSWFDKTKNKWQATIRINKKQINLGYYTTQQEAHEAYLKFLNKLPIK